MTSPVLRLSRAVRVLRVVAMAVTGCAAVGLVACSSSSSSGVDATTIDATPANQCTAYGQGYECQTGPRCSEGFVDKEDYFCGTSGDLCCGPVGEGGIDASDDANVFVDGAVFETGARDGRADVRGDASDATTRDAGGHDAAKDARSRDAGKDARSHDAGVDASAHDAGHTTPDGGAKKDAEPDAAHAPHDAGVDGRRD